MLKKFAELFNEFKSSQDTLRIYRDSYCIFSSSGDFLSPLIEYIAVQSPTQSLLTMMDKVVGNAAALLAVKAGIKRVYSPLGSELAIHTLRDNDIEYHFDKTVPYILARNGVDMCPMENMSIGKAPDEFYLAVKNRFSTPGQIVSGDAC